MRQGCTLSGTVAMPVATVGGAGHQHVHPDEIARMPPELPDEFFLSEGRPGKKRVFSK